MKQFFKILKFEFKNYLHNKIFVGVTVFLIAVLAVVMFFPRVMGIFENEEPSIPEPPVFDGEGSLDGENGGQSDLKADFPKMLIKLMVLFFLAHILTVIIPRKKPSLSMALSTLA